MFYYISHFYMNSPICRKYVLSITQAKKKETLFFVIHFSEIGARAHYFFFEVHIFRPYVDMVFGLIYDIFPSTCYHFHYIWFDIDYKTHYILLSIQKWPLHANSSEMKQLVTTNPHSVNTPNQAVTNIITPLWWLPPAVNPLGTTLYTHFCYSNFCHFFPIESVNARAGSGLIFCSHSI